MKQLKTIYAVATFMGCALFTGCNDDYLQKYPEDSLNEEAFFKNCNRFGNLYQWLLWHVWSLV